MIALGFNPRSICPLQKCRGATICALTFCSVSPDPILFNRNVRLQIRIVYRTRFGASEETQGIHRETIGLNGAALDFQYTV